MAEIKEGDYIRGGYYLKARCIQESEVAIMPPYVREIWDWLLKEANHQDGKSSGMIIKRGQMLRTFKDIQEGLHWKVGWRKMIYKKWQCENAMKLLRKAGMIVTTKTTRGMLIEVCNYSTYQNAKNYESNTKADTRATMEQQPYDTINKNDKNDKNVKKYSKEIQEVFDYFCLKTGRKLSLKGKGGEARKKILENCFKEGREVNDFKKATDNFIQDTWEGRKGSFVDIVYCFGVIRGIDKFDHWINWKPTQKDFIDEKPVKLNLFVKGEKGYVE